MVMLILGGTGRLYGAFVGAVVYMVLEDKLSKLSPTFWQFGIGLLLVLAVLFARRGLLGLVEDARPVSVEEGQAVTAVTALQVERLNRSFGALHVTRDVNLTLERGARRALIGPNGAGKTTLVNLITGALKPSAGRVLLDGEDITATSQAERARRGLARTFQINQLFRGLTVLENLCMTIGERDGHCNNLWRAAGARRAVIDEALDHLESLRLVDDALKLVRELPYGRQRLVEIAIALAQTPAGAAARRAGGGRAVVGKPSHPRRRGGARSRHRHSDHRARHGRGVALRQRDHGAGARRGVHARHAGRDHGRRAGARGLSRTGRRLRRGRGMAERALELDAVSAGYGETVVLEDIRLTLAAGETLSIIGRNGVGKSTLLATVMGHTTLHGGSIRLHGKDISQLATYRRVAAGLGLVPQEREIFPSLTLRENLEVAVRPGAWTIEAVFELFPRLSERAGNRGNQLSGGEQQMLAIGRALVGNPSVLLMDEPSEGLAPVIVEELARAVKRLTQEGSLSMVLVEQNTRLALDIAAARRGDGPRADRL